jgi:hypothetical protein
MNTLSDFEKTKKEAEEMLKVIEKTDQEQSNSWPKSVLDLVAPMYAIAIGTTLLSISLQSLKEVGLIEKNGT